MTDKEVFRRVGAMILACDRGAIAVTGKNDFLGLGREGMSSLELLQWRRTHRVKQSDLAKRAGLSQNLVSLLEAGKRNFTKASIDKLSKAMYGHCPTCGRPWNVR